MQQFTTILVTGAGSSFIRTNLLPDELFDKISPMVDEQTIMDDGDWRVAIRGTINLIVELGTRVEVVPLLIDNSLSTKVILRCDFCDDHVESIRP